MPLGILQYGFMVRALEAGVLVALLAPLIGIFLVLRRYSLIADTLSHISLAGVAIGLLAGLNPILTAIGASVISAVTIERLRMGKKVYGDTALSLFLSGGLALAVVLIGLSHGFTVDLFSYLFGSIVTVTNSDIAVIGVLGIIVIAALLCFYKELVYIAFDEEAAQVSGLPTRFVNFIFIILAAITVALCIPIIGILLISALIVIPVVTALQLKLSFTKTILAAEAVSLFSVITGIIISFYAKLSPGGTIVLLMLAVFMVVLAATRRAK